MEFKFADGGRAAAGFKGSAGDCVCRAICNVTGLSYADVYAALAKGNGAQRASSRTGKKPVSANNGINVKRKWFKDYMASLGFTWTPTMRIGQGCKVHLDAKELPGGAIVVALSKHYTAVIDGVIHDTYDPSRENSDEIWTRDITYDLAAGERLLNIDYDRGTKQVCRPIGGRCVYGYWSKT